MPRAPGAKHEKKVQKKPMVAAQKVRMCGWPVEQSVRMLHTVALCSALTGSSNSRPKMSADLRELMPRDSRAVWSVLISCEEGRFAQ